MLKCPPQDQLETESKHKLGQILNRRNWKLVELSDVKFGLDGDAQVVEGFQYTPAVIQNSREILEAYLS